MTTRVAVTWSSRAKLVHIMGIALALCASTRADEQSAQAQARDAAPVVRIADGANAIGGVSVPAALMPASDIALPDQSGGEHGLPAPEDRQHVVNGMCTSGFDEQGMDCLLQPPSSLPMTGNMRVDLFGLTAMRDAPALAPGAPGDAGASVTPSHKSLWLASGLSVLVPGAGEFYAQSYWKAALFFAVEVAAIAVAYSYDRRGDQQTDRYQDFANKHWSAVKYAKYAETLVGQEKFTWRIPGTEGMDEFDRPWTQVNWSELNRMERFIGGYYSHTLPAYGEQQYFELIGKYPQYNQGWNDAPPSFNYGDPLTPNFQFYSGERGKANDLYASASSWVTVVVVNHLLSAVDAAWSAHLFNRAQTSVSMRMVPTQVGYRPMTQLTLRYAF